MAQYDQQTQDLAHHAADSVKDALLRVLSLVDGNASKAQISIMAASQCIAMAAAYLSDPKPGDHLPPQEDQTEAMVVIIDLLKDVVQLGGEAAYAKLAS